MGQLLIPLSSPPRFTFETLVLHEGIEPAVSAVMATYPDRTPAPSLFLHGPAGTGKTHILKAIQARMEEAGTGRDRVLFPASRAAVDDLLDDGAEALPAETLAVVLDDLDLSTAQDAPRFLTLCNVLARQQIPLLAASRKAPEELFPDNPHILSRISAGLVLHLDPPEDPVRLLIMDKISRDLNVLVSRDVFRYLITRKSRNIKELETLLRLLDRASLEHKRRITIPFIKVLEAEGLV
jgi:chromosomal replication initiation ATPase DnaA